MEDPIVVSNSKILITRTASGRGRNQELKSVRGRKIAKGGGEREKRERAMIWRMSELT